MAAIPTIQTRATILAARTEDSFSVDRYRSWRGCCLALLRAGYTDREAEAILRSKWARWAADGATQRGKGYGQATGRDLVVILRLTPDELQALVSETFDAPVEALPPHVYHITDNHQLAAALHDAVSPNTISNPAIRDLIVDTIAVHRQTFGRYEDLDTETFDRLCTAVEDAIIGDGPEE